jgi:hypothetical protein
MLTNHLESMWSFSENYLSRDNTRYSVVSSGRNKVALYKSIVEMSMFLKIIRFASYGLIPPFFPLIFPLVFSKRCRQLFPYKECNPTTTPIAVEGKCEAIATKDCNDTLEWRKKLIHSAQHNIVISGNYCGGESFDDILDCIKLRIKDIPELKVVVISHPNFLTINNKKKLDYILANYKDNFTLVYSPDSYFGKKKITNHTKCTIIDYGNYFMQGGSGIKDNFAGHGFIKASNKEVLSIHPKIQDDINLNRNKNRLFQNDNASDDINLIPSQKKSKKADSFIESFLPSNFRDQDFVFHTTDGGSTGKKMFREALFLAFKWDQFTKNGFLSSDSWDLDKLDPEDPLFQDYPALSENVPMKENIDLQTEKSKNSLYQLLRTDVPKDLRQISQGHVLGFKNKKVPEVNVRAFFTGPEDSTMNWENVLVNRIQSAKKRILIDQMYFQPSTTLMQEIINAANRGVKVTVITVVGGRHSSRGEQFFGPRNLHNVYKLLSSVESKASVNAYTYSQAKNGLHKKVVIVDDYVLAGSSNMGTKSLELTADHEMNFEAHSKEFANQTLKILQEDIKKSRPLKPKSLSLSNRIFSFIHNAGSRIWG